MKNRCLNLKRIRVPFIWIVFSLISLYATTLFAGQATLAWDTSDNPSLDGYRLFMRTQSQAYDYTSPVWSGSETTCTINNLADDTYYFVARAFDGDNESENSNEVEFKVVVNQAPQADAGADQAVSADTQVTLDGSASTDPEGSIASFNWTQTAGPTVTLANAASVSPTFTAPEVAGTSTMDFTLTVADLEGLTASDTCQVTVLPLAPLDSDNDGLYDEDETNLYGTDPYNSDTDGDGISDGQEVADATDPTVDNNKTEYAKIWIEAEDGDIQSPMQVSDDSDASESSYIWVPNKAGYGGYASYEFEVKDTGDYVIWGRVLSINSSDNSFFIVMDGGDRIQWNTQKGEAWVWDQVASYDDGGDDPAIFYLEAGWHTITVNQREDGTKIDRILITKDKDYVPEGVGESEINTTKKIWLEAEDGNIYEPMITASDTKASDGAYAFVPNGAGYGGYASYEFEVKDAGYYVVWGRVLSINSSDNSFFIVMDGGDQIRWNTQKGEAWVWDQVASYDDGGDVPAIFYLEAGWHTITVNQREDGTKIDQILIANDMTYDPEN